MCVGGGGVNILLFIFCITYAIEINCFYGLWMQVYDITHSYLLCIHQRFAFHKLKAYRMKNEKGGGGGEGALPKTVV